MFEMIRMKHGRLAKVGYAGWTVAAVLAGYFSTLTLRDAHTYLI